MSGRKVQPQPQARAQPNKQNTLTNSQVKEAKQVPSVSSSQVLEAKPQPAKEQSAREGNNPEDVDLLANGPVDQRSCTDIFCFLLFIGGLGLTLYIWLLGWTKGQPNRLVAVYDASNKSCGIDVIGKPYLYFSLPHPDFLNKTTCVSECPNWEKDGIAPTSLQCNKNFWHPSCKSFCTPLDLAADKGFDMTLTFNMSELVCIYNTTLFMNRICFPDASVSSVLKDLAGPMKNQADLSMLQSWFDDLYNAWIIIAIAAGAAFVLGIIYMLFVRLFSGVIVWLCVLLYFGAVIVLAVFLFFRADEYKKEIDKNGEKEPFTKDNQLTYLYTSYAVFAIAGVSFIGLLCMWKNIRLAIAIIKTATLYVIQTPTSMLVPPLFGVLTAGWWGFWLVGFVYIYSYGDFFKSNTTVFGQVVHTQQTQGFIAYYIFGGLWVNAFLEACTQFVLASCACIWYFSQNGGGHAPVCTSIWRALRYHLGSLAFGAFLLAVVQFIRIVLAYMQRNLMAGKDNKLVQCILKCLQCYLECFERFIKFLNKAAYIQIALSGRNFCSAAREGMRMVWANAVRVSLVEGLGGAFCFIGKLFIIAASVLGAYFAILNIEPFKTTVLNPFLPCIFVLIISYAISSIFMQVYGMAIDAILMCFLYDEEMAKGRGPPKFAPQLLKEFFEENEQKE